jgi:hypothetical protein
MQTGTVTLIGGMNLERWANRRFIYWSKFQRREIIRKWVNEFGDKILIQINPDVHPDPIVDIAGRNVTFERPPATYNNLNGYKYE